ncbi:sulfatase-like hydrolase/transferase [Paraburkholderia aspalathi]|uniref:Arylsulfatase A n=1 Tax=Paraburkholderia aspalathi TaxID=1324617 RepID=A0A1I7B8N8_9BURK|nr:sulfatase-like hydrolase/transferase [Paraburkholderia aspalathi]SFT83576.1 Arylsulfatase A [Paraburkholderia aspalathi]
MTARNVLLIVTDQWRGDCMPWHEDNFLQLPNIRRLCERATVFANHYSTGSPCGPARASLMTGMYVMNHRATQNKTPMDASISNLGVELRNHGYFPASIGAHSWMPDPATTTAADYRYKTYGNNMPGWATIETIEDPDHIERYLSYLAMLGYHIPENGTDVWKPESSRLDAPSPIPSEHSDTTWATDSALRFLSGRNGKPWIFHLGYWKPHPPFIAPAEYQQRHSLETIPNPKRAASREEESEQHPFIAESLASTKMHDYVQNGTGLCSDASDDDVRHIKQHYYGLMEELDAQMGRVIARLEETGEIHNTLIVLTTDHGETMGDHYQFGKMNSFDGSYHIPLVILDPSKEADPGRGRVVEAFTESVDIVPTILDWLGISIPTQCDGQSVMPFCFGQTPSKWREEAHFEFDFHGLFSEKWSRKYGLTPHNSSFCAVRGHKFKYVHFGSLPPMLYDLEADPDETTNLAGKADYAAVELAYSQKLLSWRLNFANKRLSSYTGSPQGLTLKKL